MSDTKRLTHANTATNQASLTTYVTGFALSLFLTLAAYFSVTNQAVAGSWLTAVIVALAVAQLLVQLVFFLHLGHESRPKLNLVIFSFMVIVVGILVIGTLWIMHNLDYNMMPKDMEEHMLQEYKKGGL